MSNKKTKFKNAQILTPEEMKELREYIPPLFCSDGKYLECPSGTKEWQRLTANKGLRCDNQIQMCDGQTITCSGSLPPASDRYIQCPRPYESIVLHCNNTKIDNVLYESSNIIGIQCGNEYRFCNGNYEYGGESGSVSGSGSGGSGSGGSGSGGSGSGSVSGSGPYREYDDPQKNLL